MTKSIPTLIETIVAPRNPHLSVLVAVFLLSKLNAAAEVKFCEEAEIPHPVRNDPSVAIIGRFGGRFDVPGTSATMLVAQHLGINDVPEYQVMLSEIARPNTARGHGHLELEEMVRTVSEYGDQGQDEYWALGFVALAMTTHLQRVAEQPGREFKNFSVPCPMVKSVGLVAIPAGAPLQTIVKAWIVQRLMHRKFHVHQELQFWVIKDEADLEAACQRQDVLFIGFGGGQFPHQMKVREVAQQFGVSNKKDPVTFARIKVILKEVEDFENNPEQAKPFSLGVIMDNLNRYANMLSETIYSETVRILDCYVRRSVEFQEKCPENFRATGEIVGVSGLKVAFVESDLRSMAAYCRAVLDADICVVRRHGGNCAIISHEKQSASWYIAEEILRAEAKLARVRVPGDTKIDHAVMTGRGQQLPAPADHWYFFVENGSLLNGSHSHRDVPATKLTNRQLREIVERALTEFAS